MTLTEFSPAMLVLLLTVGCDSVAEDARIDKLETDVAALQADLADALATIEQLQTELQAGIDENATDIAENATDITENTAAIADLQESAVTLSQIEDFITMEDLAGYATEAYVTTALATYAEISYVDAGDQAATDYVDGLLEDYATVAYVDGQDSATTAYVDTADQGLSDRITAIEDDYVVSTDVADAVRLIDTDTTYSVTTAEEVLDALAELNSYLIADDATVTIDVASGTYSFTEPLYFRHASGGRIHIQGAGASSTTFAFDACDGIVVDEGSNLGYISDITVQGNDTDDTDGIYLSDAASLSLGEVYVESFGASCVSVAYRSSLAASEGLHVSGCGTGVRVTFGGWATVQNSTADNNGTGYLVTTGGLNAEYAESTDNSAFGFYASNGASLPASNTLAAGNGEQGFYVAMGAAAVLDSAEAEQNGAAGFYAINGAVIYAQGARAVDNDGYGFRSSAGSYVNAYAAYASANSSEAYYTSLNGFMNADGASGDTDKDYDYHATDDFIYGL